MATMTSAGSRQDNPEMVAAWSVSPESRDRMIREAAYYRYMRRGGENGHDMDDWLAAEANFERARLIPKPHEMEADAEPEVQQSGTFGPAEEDRLKRTIRQHPARDIPRTESVEPEMSPRKQ